jgi:RHS repeat-associated protein
VAVSGTAGRINETHAYTAEGIQAAGPAIGSAASLTPFGYGGLMSDAETGLTHNRARAYSPRLGRFLQTDPSGIQGGLNLYAYAGGDPINFADPSGLSAAELGYGGGSGGFSDRNQGSGCQFICETRNSPSLDQLTNIVYNETSSLYQLPGGPSVQPLRDAIANVVLNRVEQNVRGPVASDILSLSATAAINNQVPSAVAAYASSQAAAQAALGRDGPPTEGAGSGYYYNARPNNGTGPNTGSVAGAPFIATFGPYRNVTPDPKHAPAYSTYFAFFGQPR